MDDDSTFVPLGSPVGGLMAKLSAKRAQAEADALLTASRESGNPALLRQWAEKTIETERFAEESQYFA